MAYNYSVNDNNYKNPLNSQLFIEGFKNDRTPLDEYNLNLIITAIKMIEQNRTLTDTELQNQINENTFDVIETDGGGVPQSVKDGTDTTWNGEFE